MHPFKQSTYAKVKNMTVLTVVVLSLIVHLFINSISGSSVVINSEQICKANTGVLFKAKTNTLERNTGQGHQKYFTHINKRFQPESYVLPANSFVIAAFTDAHIEQHTIGRPTAYLLFSVIIARTLRGPPVLA